MTEPAPNFEGHQPRECGEHRTIGSHRAWCYDCSMWCYPSMEMACHGCELPALRAKVAQIDPPPGWLPFGTHAPMSPVPDLQFHEDLAEDLMPKWERCLGGSIREVLADLADGADANTSRDFGRGVAHAVAVIKKAMETPPEVSDGE